MAFTDVIQLICIFVGLIFSIPFMTANENVTIPLQAEKGNIVLFKDDPERSFWGKLHREDAGIWIDYAIMLIFGGIPWQAYFQRVLSARDVGVAKVLSFVAAFGCFCAAIPSIVIG